MLTHYLTEPMRNYSKMTEEIVKNKPKHNKAYGIKRPESNNIVVAATGIFLVLVIATELLLN